MRRRLRGLLPRPSPTHRAVALGFLTWTSGLAIIATAASAQEREPQLAEPIPETFDCVIKPSMEVKVSASATGVVESVPVDRGDRVRAGDIVATMKSDVEKASAHLAQRQTEGTARVESAKARVAYLSKRFERSRVLRSNNVVSDETVDEIWQELSLAEQELLEAEFNRTVAQLELQRSLALLKLRTIESPIDGIIVERSLSPGEFLSDEKQIVRIAAIDPLHVEAFIPVMLHGKIRVGGSAVVLPQAPIGGRYEALVEVVDQVYDAASGTFGVRLELPNPDWSLPAGIRCSLSFQVLEAKGALPSTAHLLAN